MSHAPQASDFHRRNPYVVLLLAVGALAVITGAARALTANLSVSTVFKGPLATLPVHAYAQYSNFSQHSKSLIVPDYSSYWIGVLVAVVGVIMFLAGSWLVRGCESKLPSPRLSG